MKHRANLLILLCLAVSLPLTGQYAVKKSAFPNGSARQPLTHGRINGSVGQVLVGKSGNPQYQSRAGFWAKPAENATVVAATEETLPLHFALAQNFPNPFNSSTTIPFSVARAGRISLKLYDVTGRQLYSLVAGEKQPGEYKVIMQAGDLSSGVYFVRMTANRFSAVRKLAVIK